MNRNNIDIGLMIKELEESENPKAVMNYFIEQAYKCKKSGNNEAFRELMVIIKKLSYKLKNKNLKDKISEKDIKSIMDQMNKLACGLDPKVESYDSEVIASSAFKEFFG